MAEVQSGRLANGRGGRPGLATPTSIRPSTPTPVWPIQRSTVTRTATTAIGFWRRAKAFFESYGITIERVLTDNGACYRRQGLRPRSSSKTPSSTPGPSPSTPRPTARWSATTGPCSTSGPTPGPIAQRRPEPEPSTRGSTCTTIIGTTRPSAAHPSVASTTWLGRTPRRCIRHPHPPKCNYSRIPSNLRVRAVAERLWRSPSTSISSG